MLSALFSRLVILIVGTLYPAFASYKAIRTKNLRQYVKWMMYWVVYALFTFAEVFTDIFLSWLPFYYEIKIVIVVWMMLPVTRGSSLLYRKFVQPLLETRESEIDEYISKVSQQGSSALASFSRKGINYATNMVLQTALRGQEMLTDHLKRSYSMNDVSPSEPSSDQADSNWTNVRRRDSDFDDAEEDLLEADADTNDDYWDK